MPTVRGLACAEIFNQAIDGGQDDQGVSRQEAGHQGGQFVIVAEFQFREGNGVIFVDDGNDAVPQKGDQGIAGVEVALMMFKIVMSQ